MKKSVLIILSMIFLVCSCQAKKEALLFDTIYTKESELHSDSKALKTNEVLIMKQLENQIKSGYLVNEDGFDGYSEYEYSQNDYDVYILIVKKILQNHGYNFIDIHDKVKSIFGINHGNTMKTILVEWNCPRKEVLYQLHFDGVLSANEPIQIDFENNIVSEALFIPQILDYQNEFPEIAKIEESIPVEKDSDYGKLYITRWKDIPDLDKQRKFNIQLVVNRNLYLFNDDKSKLPWLLKNDENFMKSLVLTFGWTEDEKLLKWVIENTKFTGKNHSEYGALFWNQDCSGNVKLHSNTFKYLQKTVNEDNKKNYLPAMADYVFYIADFDNEIEGLQEVDRLKIASNIAYFLEQYKDHTRFHDYAPTGYMAFGILRYLWDERQEKILSENRYFNLPKFKEWWDMADWDEYYVERENSGPFGKEHWPNEGGFKEWKKEKGE